MLDIGCGSGKLKQIFEDAGKKWYGVDITYHNKQSYEKYDCPSEVDCIWCNHVLEHTKYPQGILSKMLNDVYGGLVAITVPPRKDRIVGGHSSIWNAGLLLYNMVLAGFNCRDARIKSYGYNISIITYAIDRPSIELKHDRFDLNKLRPWFPDDIVFVNTFNGNINELNW